MMFCVDSMTCAKCNHGFCWRCLKPWKPTHKDYYNCSAMVGTQSRDRHTFQPIGDQNRRLSILTMSLLLQVSKAARQEKKFQDYNERCTFHHQAKVAHLSATCPLALALALKV